MSHGPVQPGDVLAGKYRVDRVLGKGNMGVVVAATHVDLGQRVALKFMLGKPDAEQKERFLREARAVVRLKSHHVAHVLDVGTLEDGAPYIVMEFLEGRDLSAVLSGDGPLPVERAVEYLLHACEAVGEAHAAGIVHRDLKPANLFLTHDVSGSPCVKVLDFGISKLAGGLELTQDAQALGSPLYMSPEQMNSSRDVDHRSDLWALGVVLYQLVAGKTPFHADTVQALCARVLFSGPTPLGELARTPPGFEAVILRCIQRDLDQRFRNVAELAAALAPFAPPTARIYPERVARVLGVPLSSLAVTADPAASAQVAGTVLMAGSGSTGAPRPSAVPPSTVVMAQSPFAPGGALASASASYPGVAASQPATAPQPMSASQPAVAPPMSASQPAFTPMSASQPAMAPQAISASQPAFTPMSASQPAMAQSMSASQPAGADTGLSLAASSTQALIPPAPPRSRAPLFLAAGAFVLAACAVALVALRGAGPQPPAAPNAGVAPTSTAVAPEATAPARPAPQPAPEGTAAPGASPTASAAPSASSVAGAAPTAPPLPAAKGPLKGPKPPSTGSKPSVSYDERN